MANETMISIREDEYKRLLSAEVRINIFKDFVNKSQYGIAHEDCAKFLGFSIEDEDKNG